MPQNLILELIQSLFLVNDGKSAAFVPQNSNGVTDGRRATDRPSYPNLLRSQMGYIMAFVVPIDNREIEVGPWREGPHSTT